MRGKFTAVATVLLVSLTLGGCATQTKSRKSGAEDQLRIAEVNTKLAIAYMRDGDNQQAVNKLERAIEADPSFAAAYSTLGLLYNRVGEFDKADRNFKQAIRLEPDNSAFLNNYGQVLCQNGAYDKGQEMFARARANPLYRTPEIALSNAGICAMTAGDLATAESHFRDALQINPRIPQVLLRMAMISYELERYLPARGYLQRYLEIGSHTAQSLWLGIRIERELGDKDALASYSLQLEKNYPDSDETRQLLESKKI
tara:strand:- start:2470 stop:3240 length:771 start_codon:yes stop_codon:yes gene_type:complete